LRTRISPALQALLCCAALTTGGACFAGAPAPAEMDKDLLEVTVPQLQEFYQQHKYTVTQVLDWHLARIHRYDGIYRSIETLMESGARKDAAREDAEAARGSSKRGLLWGVPIVIKANTSIEGQITTDGWSGYTMPGFELLAPKDAPIVARLRAAGAIIIGHANMPDFANSDTNRSSSFGRTGNAYDVRFSPGGSSGGVVTAITANMAVLGTGTDTGNSIRMPSATSALIGVFPTRGLVSIAGIAPLDWMLDNTGPIARDVTDAAIALSVMAGEDPLDTATAGSAAKAQPGPYTQYLKADALRGKRFGVPAFILKGTGVPFHGLPSAVPEEAAAKLEAAAAQPLQAPTRAAFMKAVDELRAAGATVVIDDSILPDDFTKIASRISTYAYVLEGTNQFLKNFGPSQYHSAAEYSRLLGSPLGEPIVGSEPDYMHLGDVVISQTDIETSADSKANYYVPRQRALEAYLEPLERLHLDGYVYPAIQMPPVDETLAQEGRLSEGPHSATSWVNMLGVPCVVVVGGFYPGGLPFGMEISGRPWKDGDLLGFAYGWEQATHHRHPPVLVERGLLTNTP
jgi:Asp-tRNA(Asn)/Glu-tRNA(Gln) amidotransferase A subunit family amidase